MYVMKCDEYEGELSRVTAGSAATFAGGGLGGTRRGGKNENIRYSGRVDSR